MCRWSYAGRTLLFGATCGLIWFSLAVQTVGDTPADARYTEDWERMRMLQFVPVRETFARRVEQDPADREARWGQAVALLNVQPRTTGNILQAQRLLEQLIIENDTDFWGLGSRFMLARMDQAHFEPPNPAAGVERLLQLAADAPGTIWGELAVLKAAPAILYAPQSTEERQQRLDEIEAQAKELTIPMIRRPLYITLADAALDFEMSAERALHYLLAADVDELVRWQRRANAYLQIAGLARELGDRALARDYYERFYREFRRDHRNYMVGRILDELAAEVTE